MVDPEEESYGIYTETDLDQLTDYSLRYAEQDTDSDDDSDECEKAKTETPNDFVQDTIKTYCTEGTPYETPLNFSTATSLSDLRDAPLEVEKPEEKPEAAAVEAVEQDTPLMFSRSSSLSSIESVDQSIHEDLESVISDFSLMSSGIISPSELPDSPTQTVPPSPRQRKSFSAKIKVPQVLEEIVEANAVKTTESTDFIQFSCSTSMTGLSVEEAKVDEVDGKLLTLCVDQPSSVAVEIYSDSTRYYCTEDTPAMQSRIGSNSNLSELSNITDPKTKTYMSDEGGNLSNSTLTLCVGGRTLGKYFSEMGGHNKSSNSLQSRVFDTEAFAIKDNDLSSLSSESEDDKDILAACINDGRRNNRYRQNVEETLVAQCANMKISETESPLPTNEKTADSSLNSENDEDILAACISDGIKNNRYRTSCNTEHELKSAMEEKRKSESENDDENILAACINDGIKNNRYRKNSLKSSEDVENKNHIVVKNKNNKSKEKTKAKREERDKKIIAACINDGIKNNRYRKSDLPSSPSAKFERFFHAISTSKKSNASPSFVCPGTPLKTSSNYNTCNNESIKTTHCDQRPRGKTSKVVRLKKPTNGATSTGNGRKCARPNEMKFNCVLAEFGPPKPRNAQAMQRNLKYANEHTNTDYTHKYYTEDTPSFLSPAESNVHLNMLAKADKTVKDDINLLRKKDHLCLNREEMAVYEVENSPCPFSLRSSLSDLTVDSSKIEGSIIGRHIDNRFKTVVNHQSSSRALSPLSINSVSSEEDRQILQQCIADGIKSRQRKLKSKGEKSQEGRWERNSMSYSTPRESFASDYSAEIRIVPSPVKEEPEKNGTSQHSSHSSLSEDSITEQEKALVQQCISDGIQWRRNKKTLETIEPYKSSSESLTSERERALVEECIMIGRMSVKNKKQNGMVLEQQILTQESQPSTSKNETHTNYMEETKDTSTKLQLISNKKELRRFRIKNWFQKLLPGRKKS